MTEDLIYTIRGSLMALPGRLAVDVAAVATPAEAIARGASRIVVGRPITGADDPVAAARAVVDEVAAALD